jgi:type-F conjugative transfer system pilin assembly protein TrbC
MLRTSLIFSALLLAPVVNADSPQFSSGIDRQSMQDITDYSQSIYQQIDWNNVGKKSSETVNVNDEQINTMQKQTGIADKNMQERRNQQMQSLGVNENDGMLYIFVSTSMSDLMLKAYAQEATFSGAILVFRGVPPDVKITDFIRDTVSPLAKDGATVQIDPRLFDAYGISAVPSIVFSRVPSRSVCTTRGKTNYTLRDKKVVPISTCGEITPENYWKLDGGVTLLWALQTFLSANAPVASRIDALKSWKPYEENLTSSDGTVSPEQYSRIISQQSADIMKQQYESGDLQKQMFISIQEAQRDGALILQP